MKIEKKTLEEVKQITAIRCDICKKEFAVEDYEECQEFLHINFTGGYGSIFGDENKVQCDICQHCLYSFISKYARINGSWRDE